MSVLIKGMNMPKGCYECPLMDGEYGNCKVGATGEYDPYRKDCPLEDLNVLCALADRACPFQGKEFAWCLTCPHISEEDRALVKKVVAEPRTGEWVRVTDEETPNVTTWHYKCDQCGAGRWEKGQRYCQNCGARMLGEDCTAERWR